MLGELGLEAAIRSSSEAARWAFRAASRSGAQRAAGLGGLLLQHRRLAARASGLPPPPGRAAAPSTAARRGLGRQLRDLGLDLGSAGSSAPGARPPASAHRRGPRSRPSARGRLSFDTSRAPGVQLLPACRRRLRSTSASIGQPRGQHGGASPAAQRARALGHPARGTLRAPPVRRHGGDRGASRPSPRPRPGRPRSRGPGRDRVSGRGEPAPLGSGAYRARQGAGLGGEAAQLFVQLAAGLAGQRLGLGGGGAFVLGGVQRARAAGPAGGPAASSSAGGGGLRVQRRAEAARSAGLLQARRVRATRTWASSTRASAARRASRPRARGQSFDLGVGRGSGGLGAARRPPVPGPAPARRRSGLSGRRCRPPAAQRGQRVLGDVRLARRVGVDPPRSPESRASSAVGSPPRGRSGPVDGQLAGWRGDRLGLAQRLHRAASASAARVVATPAARAVSLTAWIANGFPPTAARLRLGLGPLGVEHRAP